MRTSKQKLVAEFVDYEGEHYAVEILGFVSESQYKFSAVCLWDSGQISTRDRDNLRNVRWVSL